MGRKEFLGAWLDFLDLICLMTNLLCVIVMCCQKPYFLPADLWIYNIPQVSHQWKDCISSVAFVLPKNNGRINLPLWWLIECWRWVECWDQIEAIFYSSNCCQSQKFQTPKPQSLGAWEGCTFSVWMIQYGLQSLSLKRKDCFHSAQ